MMSHRNAFLQRCTWLLNPPQTFRIRSCDQTKILGAKSRFNLNGCRSNAVGRTRKFTPAWNAGCSTEFSRSDRTKGRPAA
jgi:hypothetical protein